MKPRVMILIGSASDFAIVEKAIDILETLEIPYDVKIASAHRTHEKVKKIVMKATDEGIEVFIGIAGLSAHLPGMIAANTYKPVVGVPVDVKLGGLDALYASAQMPFGAPVATVGIDRGENGALLAAQIIGIHDEDVRKRVSSMRSSFFGKIQKDEAALIGNIKGDYYSPTSYDIPEDELKNEDLSKESASDELEDIDVAIIAGSYSDIKVAKKTTNFFDKMGLAYDFSVVSPVRHPKRFEEYLKRVKNAKLFIAITGLSSHVTGAIVAYTEKPVIGVPCSIRLDGMDALLSMVNMPPGVPVATLGIDNGGNAAILAGEMMGLMNKDIERDIRRFKGNIKCDH
ncbi:MAG: 5-(carboxyamino)imidazole ribonucleotide mutase [Methanobacterium sp.]|uniref:5-(carboxyamino)imidazole ribonucleotide mutase n=1 Tax=Methanobacterium sp. TaxID=2164 RepID=UPI003D65EF97|nr:5-(carboxyamino)imidazole ribonucleotide mutase [Methanobacterium sp.]